MAVKPPKRRSERLSRKSTLINKAHELAEFCDVDVALIICNRQTSHYITYNSVDLEMEIRPCRNLMCHNSVAAKVALPASQVINCNRGAKLARDSKSLLGQGDFYTR
jgi:hypothetical protein